MTSVAPTDISAEHEEHPMHPDPTDPPTTDHDTGDPFAVLHRRRRGVWVTTAAAVALGMAVLGTNTAGVAGAASPTAPGTHGRTTPPTAAVRSTGAGGGATS